MAQLPVALAHRSVMTLESSVLVSSWTGPHWGGLLGLALGWVESGGEREGESLSLESQNLLLNLKGQKQEPKPTGCEEGWTLQLKGEWSKTQRDCSEYRRKPKAQFYVFQWVGGDRLSALDCLGGLILFRSLGLRPLPLTASQLKAQLCRAWVWPPGSFGPPQGKKWEKSSGVSPRWLRNHETATVMSGSHPRTIMGSTELLGFWNGWLAGKNVEAKKVPWVHPGSWQSFALRFGQEQGDSGWKQTEKDGIWGWEACRCTTQSCHPPFFFFGLLLFLFSKFCVLITALIDWHAFNFSLEKR